jgi:hypothetical protein
MSGPGVGLLVALLKAVGRLALPAHAQLEDLQRRGLLPSADELALDLHDGVALLPQFVANGWLDPQDASAIATLDEMLAQMSGSANNALWTGQALTEASEWEDVRRQARAVFAG